MLLKPLALAAAGLAAATEAFLLPPKISESDVEVVNALPDIDIVTLPERVLINVPCPGCIPQPNSVGEIPSHLVVEIRTYHSPARDTLLLNGFQLYPAPAHTDPRIRFPMAAIRPDVENRRLRHELHDFDYSRRKLAFLLAVHEPVAEEDDGLAVVNIDFQIVKVGDTYVSGIPDLRISLVKDVKTGALHIGSVLTGNIQPYGLPAGIAVPVGKPTDKQEECASLKCKWLAIMKDHMSKLKGKPCPGKMRGGTKGSRPHHDNHHHHGGNPNKTEGHAHYRSWGQLVKNLAAHILLPGAIGIIAGVTVSLVGMMVGTLIISVWRFFFRRPSHRRSRSHSHTHSHHKAPKVEVAAAEAEEKSGLLEHQDPPPYEEEVAPKADV